MAERLTYEYVKNYIEIESSSGCKLLSKEYINNQSYLKLLCECGNRFETSFSQFKNRNKQCCNECSSKLKVEKQKHNYTYVYNYFKDNGYILLSERYINTHTKLKTMCPNKHIHYISFANFKTGYRCPECYKEKSSERQRHPINYVKQYFSNYGYKLLSKKYINSSSPLKVECPSGHIYDVRFDNFKSGKRCPYCSGRIISYGYVKKSIENEGYTLLSKNYKNNHIKLKIQCDNSHIFKMTWGNFQSGSRCPICSASKGEKKIAEILALLKINYIPQFSFDDKDMTRYKFDFALFGINKDLISIIEYDGIQHYEPVDYFGGKNKFNQQRRRDQIKNQYCKDNNIPLLRIPYWEFDSIEQILDKWLHKYNLLHKDKVDNLETA